MRYFIFILLLNSSFGLVAQNKNQLQEAFEKNDPIILRNFFTNWEKENLKSIEISPYKEDVNKLFKIVFDPLNIHKITGLNLWDSVYNNCRYFVIQTKVPVHIVRTDSLKRTEIFADSLLDNFIIKDFCPDLDFKNKRIIYYSENYEKLFSDFLNDSVIQKADFIKDYINIQAEKSRKKAIITQPQICDIYFNNNKNMARLDFSIFDQKGSAFFIRENQSWKMILSNMKGY